MSFAITSDSFGLSRAAGGNSSSSAPSGNSSNDEPMGLTTTTSRAEAYQRTPPPFFQRKLFNAAAMDEDQPGSSSSSAPAAGAPVWDIRRPRPIPSLLPKAKRLAQLRTESGSTAEQVEIESEATLHRLSQSAASQVPPPARSSKANRAAVASPLSPNPQSSSMPSFAFMRPEMPFVATSASTTSLSLSSVVATSSGQQQQQIRPSSSQGLTAQALQSFSKPTPNRFPAEAVTEDDDALAADSSESDEDLMADFMVPGGDDGAQDEIWSTMSMGYATEDEDPEGSAISRQSTMEVRREERERERSDQRKWTQVRSARGSMSAASNGGGPRTPFLLQGLPSPSDRPRLDIDFGFMQAASAGTSSIPPTIPQPSTPTGAWPAARRTNKRKTLASDPSERFEPYAAQAFKRRAVSPATGAGVSVLGGMPSTGSSLGMQDAMQYLPSGGVVSALPSPTLSAVAHHLHRDHHAAGGGNGGGGPHHSFFSTLRGGAGPLEVVPSLSLAGGSGSGPSSALSIHTSTSGSGIGTGYFGGLGPGSSRASSPVSLSSSAGRAYATATAPVPGAGQSPALGLIMSARAEREDEERNAKWLGETGAGLGKMSLG